MFLKLTPSKSVKERKGERSLALHECLANSAEYVKNKLSKANISPFHENRKHQTVFNENRKHRLVFNENRKVHKSW